VWDLDFQPNHTYLFDGNKAVAYVPQGKTEAIYFTKPLNIDRSRRKFVEVKVNPFKTKIESNLIRVVGSKGDVYHIDPIAKTCTCSGYKFRGNCKHLGKIV
jgi:hypothetical protein